MEAETLMNHLSALQAVLDKNDQEGLDNLVANANGEGRPSP